MDMMQFAYYLGYFNQANWLDTYEMKTFHNMHGAFSCNLFLHSTKISMKGGMDYIQRYMISSQWLLICILSV